MPVITPKMSNLSNQELEINLTQLAANINAATYRLLLLIAEFDRREAWAMKASNPAPIG